MIRRKTYIKRLGRVGKLRRKGMEAAKKLYGEGPCQRCGRSGLVLTFHHKTKRSERGTEKPENLVGVCWGNPRSCHSLIHSNPDIFELVKASPVNILTRGIL